MTRRACHRLAGIVVSTFLFAGSLDGFASADDQDQSQAIQEFLHIRDSMTDATAKKRKIDAPNGIDVLEAVQIGGLEQWISVRSYDIDNPILLYLHGGPGATVLPFSYLMDESWEKNFVMVQWDQRGTGKTRCANPHYDPALATFEEFFADTIEMVNYLRQRLDKDKVFVLGHSWGSVLGLHLAKKHPELLYAYVGTGQVVDTWEQEKAGYEFVVTEAEKRGDEEAITALTAIAPYPSVENFEKKIGIQRKYMQEFGGSLRIDYFTFISKAFFESPDYSICDWVGFLKTNFEDPHRAIVLRMLPANSDIGNFNLYGYKYDVPIFFFLGDLDRHTSTAVARQFFNKIDAPLKKLLTLDNAGHAAPYENEEKFVEALTKYVRPLAQ